MKAFKLPFLVTVFCFNSISAQAVEYVFQRDRSSLAFTATTWALTVRGTFSDWVAAAKVTGSGPTDVTFNFTVKTASLDTNNRTRDKHLRAKDFFWVDEFPTATFESTQIAPLKNGVDYHIKGNLTIRGITKPVEFDARMEKNQNSYRVFGHFDVKRQDFGMVYAGSSLMPIRDDVRIDFDVRGIAKD